MRKILDEEMERIRAEVGDETWEKGRPDETREIFEKVALSDESSTSARCCREEMDKIHAEVGDETWEKGQPEETRASLRAGRALRTSSRSS